MIILYILWGISILAFIIAVIIWIIKKLEIKYSLWVCGIAVIVNILNLIIQIGRIK